MKYPTDPYGPVKPRKYRLKNSRQVQSIPRLMKQPQSGKSKKTQYDPRKPSASTKFGYADSKDFPDHSDVDLYESAHERAMKIQERANREMYLPSLQRKPAPEKVVVVNDVKIIGKNFLVNLLQFDSQEESIFNYDLNQFGVPKVVQVDSLPDVIQERRFERDYLLLDMRDPHEYQQCHIYDGKRR